MSVIACGEEHGDTLRLFRLEDGASLPEGAPFDALLLSRLDCDVRFVDLPPVPEREVEGLLSYRLRSIYPGNPQDTLFDFRVFRDGASRRAVLFISRRATVERYRASGAGKPLLIPCLLAAAAARNRDPLRVWFCAGTWMELVVIREGMPVSSMLCKREAGDASALLKAESGLPEDVRAIPVFCAAAGEDAAGAPPAWVPEGMEFLPLRRLTSRLRRTDAVFREGGRRGQLFPDSARIAVLAAIACLLLVLVFYKYVGISERRAGELCAMYGGLETESRRVLAVQKEVERLQADLSRLRERRTGDAYALVSLLRAVIGEEARITALVIRDTGFQADAVGRNPLRLMEGFRSRGEFRDVQLTQVLPDARTGKERFSFMGTFHAP